jgi:hypothetical protein
MEQEWFDLSSNFFTPTIFQVYGVFFLLVAICTLGFYFSNPEHMIRGEVISLRGFYICTPVSFGLFYRRKWAAIILSAFLLYIAVISLAGTLTLAFLFWSPVLVLPAFATYHCWKDLVWKGKYLV